ncbi:hypothetical protein KBB76_03185, partial [Candidatus Saccharibacteria bacterium]|nr:hypothetical protein [Candidatus Saccharibacteria bacterium]
ERVSPHHQGDGEARQQELCSPEPVAQASRGSPSSALKIEAGRWLKNAIALPLKSLSYPINFKVFD